MEKFVIRWLINAVGLYAAVNLVQGIQMSEGSSWLTFAWLALIFGFLNAIVRPLLKLLTCPLLILTLGLGTFLINMLMFYLAGVIGSQFGVGFTVDGFWATALGALIVSVVSIILSLVFREELKNK